MNGLIRPVPRLGETVMYFAGARVAVAEGRAYDLQLALRLKERDEHALAELYDRYAALAFTLALRILSDRETAEDVVQECFLSVWRNASGFDPDRSSFRTWFVTIVRNRSFDKLRSRAAQPRISPEAEIADHPAADDVAATVSRNLTAERVRQGLAVLPDEQRRTLELAYYGGLTQSEIAERMGVPLGTVKGRVRMATSKLREQLSGLQQGEQA